MGLGSGNHSGKTLEAATQPALCTFCITIHRHERTRNVENIVGPVRSGTEVNHTHGIGEDSCRYLKAIGRCGPRNDRRV